uniref:Ribonuclease H protein At1g65750 family n=1 Tax=Cajanus cajan TaxID=3821 RepID=A0A151U361_CAJCA|nr:Putative ribonuclease H protein At1g65750 family [Cajanus cajan]
MRENFIYQKAITRWMKEGDANTSYFHACIRGCRRKNQIIAWKGENGWIKDVEGLKKGDVSFILKVNFEKVYDSVNWAFLDYMMGRLGFTILDEVSWQFSTLKHKLASWKGRCLSLGGWIILINSILSSLPLYFFVFFLSFFKLPKKVLKTIIGIKKSFLWSGKEDSLKIDWVKWQKVRQLKKLGGLGIKNIEIFNLGLLAKWRWHFFD